VRRFAAQGLFRGAQGNYAFGLLRIASQLGDCGGGSVPQGEPFLVGRDGGDAVARPTGANATNAPNAMPGGLAVRHSAFPSFAPSFVVGQVGADSATLRPMVSRAAAWMYASAMLRGVRRK
jgi:hypothetical protein